MGKSAGPFPRAKLKLRLTCFCLCFNRKSSATPASQRHASWEPHSKTEREMKANQLIREQIKQRWGNKSERFPLTSAWFELSSSLHADEWNVELLGGSFSGPQLSFDHDGAPPPRNNRVIEEQLRPRTLQNVSMQKKGLFAINHAP